MATLAWDACDEEVDEAKANATNYELKLADDDAPHPSRYLLKVGVTSVGRLEDNDLVIDSASVSGHHALIRVDHDFVFVQDKGSRNGTRLQDVSVLKDVAMQVCVGNRVAFGGVVYTLERGEQPSALEDGVDAEVEDEEGGDGDGATPLVPRAHVRFDAPSPAAKEPTSDDLDATQAYSPESDDGSQSLTPSRGESSVPVGKEDLEATQFYVAAPEDGVEDGIESTRNGAIVDARSHVDEEGAGDMDDGGVDLDATQAYFDGDDDVGDDKKMAEGDADGDANGADGASQQGEGDVTLPLDHSDEEEEEQTRGNAELDGNADWRGGDSPVLGDGEDEEESMSLGAAEDEAGVERIAARASGVAEDGEEKTDVEEEAEEGKADDADDDGEKTDVEAEEAEEAKGTDVDDDGEKTDVEAEEAEEAKGTDVDDDGEKTDVGEEEAEEAKGTDVDDDGEKTDVGEEEAEEAKGNDVDDDGEKTDVGEEEAEEAKGNDVDDDGEKTDVGEEEAEEAKGNDVDDDGEKKDVEVEAEERKSTDVGGDDGGEKTDVEEEVIGENDLENDGEKTDVEDEGKNADGAIEGVGERADGGDGDNRKTAENEEKPSTEGGEGKKGKTQIVSALADVDNSEQKPEQTDGRVLSSLVEEEDEKTEAEEEEEEGPIDKRRTSVGGHESETNGDDAAGNTAVGSKKEASCSRSSAVIDTLVFDDEFGGGGAPSAAKVQAKDVGRRGRRRGAAEELVATEDPEAAPLDAVVVRATRSGSKTSASVLSRRDGRLKRNTEAGTVPDKDEDSVAESAAVGRRSRRKEPVEEIPPAKSARGERRKKVALSVGNKEDENEGVAPPVMPRRGGRSRREEPATKPAGRIIRRGAKQPKEKEEKEEEGPSTMADEVLSKKRVSGRKRKAEEDYEKVEEETESVKGGVKRTMRRKKTEDSSKADEQDGNEDAVEDVPLAGGVRGGRKRGFVAPTTTDTTTATAISRKRKNKGEEEGGRDHESALWDHESALCTPVAKKAKREASTVVAEELTPSRRRTVSNVGADAGEKVIVMFTGVQFDAGVALVTRLGGQVVDSPEGLVGGRAVVVTDAKLKRTVKLLCAICMGASVVTVQWIHECERLGHFASTDATAVHDRTAERKWNFQLNDAVRRARSARLLQGKRVYVTAGVRPPPAEMATIVECAGGTSLTSAPTGRVQASTIVVSTADERKRLLAKYKGPVHSSELLLSGALKQHLELDEHLL